MRLCQAADKYNSGRGALGLLRGPPIGEGSGLHPGEARNLRFIPTSEAVRAADARVSVDPGFRSGVSRLRIAAMLDGEDDSTLRLGTDESDMNANPGSGYTGPYKTKFAATDCDDPLAPDSKVLGQEFEGLCQPFLSHFSSIGAAHSLGQAESAKLAAGCAAACSLVNKFRIPMLTEVAAAHVKLQKAIASAQAKGGAPVPREGGGEHGAGEGESDSGSELGEECGSGPDIGVEGGSDGGDAVPVVGLDELQRVSESLIQCRNVVHQLEDGLRVTQEFVRADRERQAIGSSSFAQCVLLVGDALRAVFNHRRQPAAKTSEWRLRNMVTGRSKSVGRCKVSGANAAAVAAASLNMVLAEVRLHPNAHRVKLLSSDGAFDGMLWRRGQSPSTLYECRRQAEDEIYSVVREAKKRGEGEAGAIKLLKAIVADDLAPAKAGAYGAYGGGLAPLPSDISKVLVQEWARAGKPAHASRRGGGPKASGPSAKKPLGDVVVSFVGRSKDKLVREEWRKNNAKVFSSLSVCSLPISISALSLSLCPLSISLSFSLLLPPHYLNLEP